VFPDGKPMVDAQGRPASPKSRLAAALLAFFLGALGIHRFSVGKIGTGILMIVTLGGLGLWALIDFIVILVGAFRDKEERVLSNW
jgi:TM2 domain-containing membrane protein YozV